jgi:hypothetical protein
LTNQRVRFVMFTCAKILNSLNISLLIFLQATEYWLIESPWADTCTLSVPIFYFINITIYWII